MKKGVEEMKSEYVTLLTVIASIVSGWGGAFIAGHFSRKASTDAIEKERDIEEKKNIEIEKRNLLGMYITLIRLDYEENPVSYQNNGAPNLDGDFFHQEVRPRIYTRYYAIHEDIIKEFNYIEERISIINSSNNYDETDFIDIAYSYENMIEEIKLIVDKERFKYK